MDISYVHNEKTIYTIFICSKTCCHECTESYADIIWELQYVEGYMHTVEKLWTLCIYSIWKLYTQIWEIGSLGEVSHKTNSSSHFYDHMNTTMPTQLGRHFEDVILKLFFSWIKIVWISFKVYWHLSHWYLIWVSCSRSQHWELMLLSNVVVRIAPQVATKIGVRRLANSISIGTRSRCVHLGPVNDIQEP